MSSNALKQWCQNCSYICSQEQRLAATKRRYGDATSQNPGVIEDRNKTAAHPLQLEDSRMKNINNNLSKTEDPEV